MKMIIKRNELNIIDFFKKLKLKLANQYLVETPYHPSEYLKIKTDKDKIKKSHSNKRKIITYGYNNND